MDCFLVSFLFFIIFEGDNRFAHSINWYESFEGKEAKVTNPFTVAHAKWPNGIIYYTIDPTAAKDALLIFDAFENFEQNTCIRFVPREYENNYINIMNGVGCYSNVGMMGGAQPVSIGAGCDNLGNVLAVLAYTVGLLHEHNRPDRDAHIAIRFPDIYESALPQFTKLAGDETKLLTPLDTQSVTLFGEKSFSKTGHSVLRSLYNVYLPEVYEKTRLSDGDIAGINFLYKCK